MGIPKNIKRQILDLHLFLERNHGPHAHRPAAKNYLEKHFNLSLKRAQKRDGVVEYFEQGGKVRAAFLLWNERFKIEGSTVLNGVVLCSVRSAKAKHWILETAAKYRFRYNQEMHVRVSQSLDFLIPGLSKSGLFVNDVILSGRVDRALSLLRKKYPTLDGDAPEGFRFEPLRTELQMKACLSICKSEFSRNPQFGWFCATSGYLKYLTKQCRQSMKSKFPSEFVMTKDGKVFGQLGFAKPRYIPYLGARRAGIGLTFHRRVHGRGYAKYYYHFLLTVLEKRGVKYFQGGTSQGPVMKMAKIMKRQPVAYILSGKKYFAHEHFGIN
jgi:hypothetical protein